MKLPKTTLLILLIFSLNPVFSADSLKYDGNWYKIYPFDHSVDLYEKHELDNDYEGWQELFIPAGMVADGRYMQIIRLEDTKDWKLLRTRGLNTVGKRLVPYVIFEVQNGMLNGPAFFLSTKGDTVLTGLYTDNLREGVWRYGENLHNYYTYRNGLLDGISFEYEKHTPRKKRYTGSEQSKTLGYEQGLLMTEISEYRSGDYHTRDEYKWVRGEEIERESKYYVNGVLAREANLNYNGNMMGPCRYYHPETGKLQAEIDYDTKIHTDTKLMYFWGDMLDEMDGIPRFVGIDYSSYMYRPYSLMGENPNVIYDYYFDGEGKEYYPDGTLLISYHIDGARELPDTLYHSNGQPWMFAWDDTLTDRFIGQFYDESGRLSNEIIRAHSYYEQKPDSVKMYKGYALRYGQYDDLWEYEYIPSFEEVVASKEIVYTKIIVRGDQPWEETYYDFATNTRVHLEYGDSLWVYRETRMDFDSAFVNAQVKITTRWTNGLESSCRFNASYQPLNTGYFAINNFYEMEEHLGNPPEESEVVYYLPGHFRRSYDYDYDSEPTNYFDPYMKLTGVQNDYLLNGESLTSEIEIDYQRRKSHISQTSEKTRVKLSGIASAWTEQSFYTHDRVMMRSQVNTLELFADLLTYLPEPDQNASYLSYTNYYNWASFAEEIVKITGAMLEGRLHGEWKIYSKKGLCVQMSFDRGIPVGEATVFMFPWKGPSYCSQVVNYQDGKVLSSVFYHTSGDTLVYVAYENGVVAYCGQYVIFDYNEGSTRLQVASEFKDGKLVAFTDMAPMGEAGPVRVNCVNEMPEGPWVFTSDSGYVSNGRFTGQIQSNQWGEEYNTTIIYDVHENILVRETYIKEGLKLRTIDYDTSVCTLNAEVRESVFSFFPLTRIPEIEESDFSYYCDARRMTRFYSNDVRQSEGPISGNYFEKYGTWYYYNPAGQLVNQVDYNCQETDTNCIADRLLHYENGKLAYEAIVNSFFTAYNCDSDQDYELRTLTILADYNSDGTIKENPTRYHRNFYDFGVLQSEGELVDGLPNGQWKFYDSEGVLCAIGVYKMGSEEGAWFFGDLSGLNNLGDMCLNTSMTDLESYMEELKRDLYISVKIYKDGRIMDTYDLIAYKH